MIASPLPSVAVIGGGPAGLMAAETARAAGCAVELYDALGSVGRKFLIAGKGGLNLTHSEPRPQFDRRYRERRHEVARWLDAFDAEALRAWARGFGVDTFVGTSGRVFPTDLKAAPLLRGWVRRLREQGVRFHVHHRWLGWHANGALRFGTTDGERAVRADATVLALGGGSWPVLGSDGAWVPRLVERGIDVAALQPANCGFEIAWSAHFAGRHAGQPVKPVVLAFDDADGRPQALQGEFVITEAGIEGSLVYALSAPLREALHARGELAIRLDLVPGRSEQRLAEDLAKPRGGRSLSEHLRRHAGIDGVKAGLLFEVLGKQASAEPARLAATLKQLPLTIARTRPLDEAISTAGGVRLEAMTDALMLRALPGTFCAGEMLDWEAPTGGYLLTACYASGRVAGAAAAAWAQAQAASAVA